ncbi:MAG: hypothetical protein ACRENE_26775 [Polyangiaceae bacterium]
MPYSKLRSFYVGLPGFGLLAVLVASCGSSNSGSSGDAGDDIAHKPVEIITADGSGDDGSIPGGPADSTTGLPCTKDSDCAAMGGPGINVCSSSLVEVIGNVVVSPLPSPICLLPPGNSTNGANCDPAPTSGPNADPMGMQFHFCDGPDDPSSPGICVPMTTPTTTGLGVCELACTFMFDGSAAQGCPGQDTCQIIPTAVLSDNTGAAVGGVGYCRGSCEKDADCADLNTARAAAGPDAGPPWVCQVDLGFCTQNRVTTRSKALGTACVSAGRSNDNASGACNCGIYTSSNKAYCTSACIVGGTVPCPNGWLCDDLQSATLPDGTTLTKETQLTPGVCVPGCTLPAEGGVPEAAAPEASVPEASAPGDASADALGEASGDAEVEASAPPEAGSSSGDASSAPDSGQGSSSGCPATSTCQVQTPLGPECLP